MSTPRASGRRALEAEAKSAWQTQALRALVATPRFIHENNTAVADHRTTFASHFQAIVCCGARWPITSQNGIEQLWVSCWAAWRQVSQDLMLIRVLRFESGPITSTCDFTTPAFSRRESIERKLKKALKVLWDAHTYPRRNFNPWPICSSLTNSGENSKHDWFGGSTLNWAISYPR